MDAHWREEIVDREVLFLDTVGYPPNAPLTARPDWRRAGGRAALTAADMASDALDRWNIDIAICNCLFGVQLIHNDDMAVAFARAVNDWIAAEWLDRDPRLRASIVLPIQSVERSIHEIERLADDRRFVQAMVPCMGDAPLGRRQFWPIYAALERHGLPLAIHAGSSYRHPVTSLGWPSYLSEDYAAQSQGFQSQLASLVCEGVFTKFPGLKVVLMESGVTWLPGFAWRVQKFWRAMKREAPWVERLPTEIVRDHFRLTIQPFDAPADAGEIERVIEHFESDEMFLFASDYPHWQFDGDAVMPAGIPQRLHGKIERDNALATYARLRAV
jgi:predicted TIM-barrel fold metal-dependent hydrolase